MKISAIPSEVHRYCQQAASELAQRIHQVIAGIFFAAIEWFRLYSLLSKVQQGQIPKELVDLTNIIVEQPEEPKPIEEIKQPEILPSGTDLFEVMMGKYKNMHDCPAGFIFGVIENERWFAAQKRREALFDLQMKTSASHFIALMVIRGFFLADTQVPIYLQDQATELKALKKDFKSLNKNLQAFMFFKMDTVVSPTDTTKTGEMFRRILKIIALMDHDQIHCLMHHGHHH